MFQCFRIIKALFLKGTAAVEHALMIYLSSNDVFFVRILFVKLSHTFQSEIIALCGTTCEDYFF